MSTTSASNSRGDNSQVTNTGVESQGERFTDDFNYNGSKMKNMFFYPDNVDFLIREVQIRSIDKKAMLLFMHGMVNDDAIQRYIIVPLLEDNLDCNHEELGTAIMGRIVSAKSVKKIDNFEDAGKRITCGETIILIEGYDKAISVGTTGYESRPVEKPTAENVIKGAKEAFTESEKANRSLVRKHLRYEKLITESLVIQNRAFNEVFIMYIKDITNQEIIDSVKKRLNSISVDNIDALAILEQYIEDRSYSIVPTTLLTERPDRVVAFLREGHVAVFMDGSPYALIVPITFWSLFQTSEEMYQRWPYAIFIRIIRMVAIFIALLTPGLYIAITNYHVDMIPTDLVLAIAATRERLPFPVFLEALLMEITFEILREAGIRIPTPIGPTIGIVGALILGQAAVQANVVSPILVIVVAITGLSSFAIPENSLSYTIRIGRFILLFSGMALGFYGLSACFICILAYISTVKSFGVAFFAPIAPHYRSSKDTVIRPPVWKLWLRPLYTKPKDAVRERNGKNN